MKPRLLSTLLVTVIAAATLAAPPSAQTLIDAANKKAAKEHKTVMVMFSASWCGWCHKFQDWLKKPEISKVMDKYFVQVVLDVQERPEKADLENAGGEELLSKWGGDKQGIPFTVFLDPKGKVLADSRRDGKSNIGFPAAPEEIDWWFTMLTKGAPKLTAAEKSLFRESLAAK